MSCLALRDGEGLGVSCLLLLEAIAVSLHQAHAPRTVTAVAGLTYATDGHKSESCNCVG